jgi:hypothetical protein
MASGANVVRSPVRSILVSLILLAALAACSKSPDAAPVAAAQAPGATGLHSIPAPDPSKYSSFRDTGEWKNPYLVVREDGIGLVDLSNHEVHILKPDEVPAELAALPSSAWPYGRVVLVASAVPKLPTDRAKAELRKNRGLLAGTLREMNVQIREAP